MTPIVLGLAIIAVVLAAALAFMIGRQVKPVGTIPSTATPFNVMTWLTGNKTYIVAGVGILKIWYPLIAGHPWSDQIDTAMNYTLAALGVAAVRSAIKTSTAQVVNATVSPSSPAAQLQAKTIPEPPKELIK